MWARWLAQRTARVNIGSDAVRRVLTRVDALGGVRLARHPAEVARPGRPSGLLG